MCKVKVYHTISREVFHGMQFAPFSIRAVFENGTELICSEFSRTESGITMYLYNGSGAWKRICNNGIYTDLMEKYYRRWFKEKHDNLDYAAMMKHDRKRKTGSAGQRLTPFCGQVTDYECAKVPLHDFRRVWN